MGAKNLGVPALMINLEFGENNEVFSNSHLVGDVHKRICG